MEKTLEIILHDDIQRIFDNFAAVMEVGVLFYSTDRKILRRGLNRPNSPFCQMIQDDFYGAAKCFAMDEEKCHECERTRSIVSYVCHAGVGEAVAPIYVEGQLTGYAMIGQYRLTEKISPDVLRDARTGNLENKILRAFRRLPYFAPDKLKDILGLFSILVDYIIAREIVSLKGERLLSKAAAYIGENLNRSISLDEIAALMGKSRSTASHIFRKSLGKSFKQIVLEAKLNRADELFCSAPWLTVQDVAFQLGFTDQFYFSRLYKKYRGIPPTVYRDNFRGRHK